MTIEVSTKLFMSDRDGFDGPIVLMKNNRTISNAISPTLLKRLFAVKMKAVLLISL